MPRKAKPIETTEIAVQLSQALRRTTQRPTIYGYRPHPKQEQFHMNTKTGALLIGGNRSGKTTGGAAESIYRLKGEHPNKHVPPSPVRGRGVAVDFDHGVAKIMLPEIARWIPPSLLINGSWDDSYSKGERTLTLTNNSFMEFLTYEQEVDKHSGTSRHFVWFDEEPPEEIYNENMMRLIDVQGSWYITMTPVEGLTWVFDRIYQSAKDGARSDVAIIEIDTDENTYISAAEIDVYLTGLSDEDKEARRQGKFIQRGGLIYANKHFSPEVNVIPDIVGTERWATIKKGGWALVSGMDHGFTNPTVWLWAACDTEGRIIIFEEYSKTKEIVKSHSQQILSIERNLGIRPAYRVGDPSIKNVDPITGTSIQLEYIRNGLPIVPGNNDVKAGIEAVASLFANKKLFITERCQYLIWELNRYRWATWSTKKVAANHDNKEQPMKKNDHACDALRYIVASRYKFDTQVDEKPDNPFRMNSALAMGAEGVRRLAESKEEFVAVPDFTLGTEY